MSTKRTPAMSFCQEDFEKLLGYTTEQLKGVETTSKEVAKMYSNRFNRLGALNDSWLAVWYATQAELCSLLASGATMLEAQHILFNTVLPKRDN